jgi:hypothetical protein
MVDAVPMSAVGVRRLPDSATGGETGSTAGAASGAGGAAGAGSGGLMGSPGMGPPDHIKVLAGELLTAPPDSALPQA